MRKNILVEIAGLSGAGKTWVGKSLEPMLAQHGLKGRVILGNSVVGKGLPRSKQRVQVLKCVCIRPILSFKIFYFLALILMRSENRFRHPVRYKVKLLAKWFKRWSIYSVWYRNFKKDGDVVIRDRGACADLHGILSRIDGAVPESAHRFLYQSGLVADILVTIPSNPEKIYSRRKKLGREEKYWQSSPVYEWEKFHEINRMLKYLVKRKGGICFSLDNSSSDLNLSDLDAACNKIASYREQG